MTRAPVLGCYAVRVLFVLADEDPLPCAFSRFDGHGSGRGAPIKRLLALGLVANVRVSNAGFREVRGLALTDAGRAQVAAVRLLLAGRPDLGRGAEHGPLAVNARVPVLGL